MCCWNTSCVFWGRVRWGGSSLVVLCFLTYPERCFWGVCVCVLILFSGVKFMERHECQKVDLQHTSHLFSIWEGFAGYELCVCVCVCITVCESDLGLQVPGRFIGDPVALSIRLSVCKSAGLVLLYTGFLSHESDCLICVLWLVFTEIRHLADALSCSINSTGEYGLDLLVLTARCIQVRDLKTLSSVKVLKLCVCFVLQCLSCRHQ